MKLFYLFTLPFFNAFVLYVSTVPGQLFYPLYEKLKNNLYPRLPISHKMLGGCITCTSFWMGFVEIAFVENSWFGVMLLFYNAVISAILYKAM